jgi:DNA-binding transcriptional LysR family regulator
LARLEERLDARLLRRTTRSLVLTDAGEALYRHARIALEAVANAEASVRRSDDVVRGDLRVSVPPMNDAAFLEVIAAFVEAHPEVRLQIHFSSRHVDLKRDGYDAALRASTEIEPGLVARTLVKAGVVAVASPKYLATRSTPAKARDLKAHRCLLGFAKGELPQTHWTANGRRIQLGGVFFSNNPALLCRLAVRGQGIAFLPERVAAKAIDRGELVLVLPKVLRSEGRIAIVYLERELMPPQLRAFVDWMVARVPKALDAHDVVRAAPRESARRGARRS